MPAEDWDPRSPEVLADQLGAYDRMRDTCPVAHSEYLGWSVFRHRDVVAIAEDVQHFSSQVSSRHAAVPNGFDPPQHGRYRAVVDRYFGPDDMAGLEPRLRTIANELINGLLGEGEAEVEFIDRFALSYAVRAQRAWLNWPVHMETELRAWVTRNRRAVLAGDRPQLDEVARDFDAAVRRVVSERRAIPPPPDDVTGRLIAESTADGPLTDEEIVSILRNWTVGELGTMSASVGILLGYLATHHELQDTLRRTPTKLPAAIDEILRVHAPLLSNRRVTTTAVRVGDQDIGAGQPITIFWASANRDPAVFGDPDEFRPDENAAKNVLYGRGIHFCPGAPLARLELRVALECLLNKTSSIRPVPNVPPVRAVYPASGFAALPLRFVR